MQTVLIIDTSVFLNALNVPGFNQRRVEVLKDLEQFIRAENVNMLLPLAAILETGNHIAQLSDGRLRREYATKFASQVRQAIQGTAPWTPTQSIEIRPSQLG